MRRPLVLEKDQPYHVVVRAVDGRTIFPSEEERLRFVLQMYAANIGSPGLNLYRKNVREACSSIFLGKEPHMATVDKKHNPLLSFFSFALVGNHYHFGVIGHFDGAISTYLQKLHTGFAKFFNAKHSRTGPLFETRFRAVPIESQRQLAALVRYINIKNVLDMYDPKWAKKSSINIKAASTYLQGYRYSSYSDLFGKRSSLLIPPSSFKYLEDILGEELRQYRRDSREQVSMVIASRGVESNENIFIE